MPSARRLWACVQRRFPTCIKRRHSLSRSPKQKAPSHVYPFDFSSIDAAQADFSLALLREFAPEESKIVSPASFGMLLMMVAVGAQGRTKEEILKAVGGVEVGEEAVERHFLRLMEDVAAESTNFELKMANRLYVDWERRLHEEFVARFEAKFPNALRTADFARKENVAEEINAFVKETTNGLLAEAVDADSVQKHFPILGVNALFFKASWEKPFNMTETRLDAFHFDPKRLINVRMMGRKDKFWYARDENCQVLGLPYTGDNTAMFVFLPHKMDGLATLETTLDGRRCLELIRKAGSNSQVIKARIPLFRVATDLSARDHFGGVGIHTAFDPFSADFTAMDGIDDLGRRLFIGDVRHQAIIEVNEDGTVVAAVTCSIYYGCSGIPSPSVPVFLADHPFLFFIVKGTDVLFVGRCAEESSFDQREIDWDEFQRKMR
ncbi:hypothetical protein QR680_012807 [Steinernema hermaphroditum]|uniref:Serpin domain-containing protein n=1 Tax=Steinernema hermaphroditum TaxID=289476 RepID=A0AA39M1E5_9BILA|nr:hypothetical protein QR680_012807 [Steinernema hermaphroditum]